MRIDIARSFTPVPIAVNGEIVDRAGIAREVQHHPGGSPKQAWDAATRALVVRALLLQRAHALGLTAEPRSADGLRETEEEALIRALLEVEIQTPTADEATCRRYYDNNPAQFRGPDLFEPLHILFQARRDDAAAYALAEERAAHVLDVLRADPSRFEVLARQFSDCPSAAEGGRLGQVSRGDTTPEFEAALVAMTPGMVHPEPIRTRYGVHLVRLDRMATGEVRAFELVRERIARYLEARSWRRAAAQYVALLAGQARIEGFAMPGAESPLVQ